MLQDDSERELLMEPTQLTSHLRVVSGTQSCKPNSGRESSSNSIPSFIGNKDSAVAQLIDFLPSCSEIKCSAWVNPTI